MKDIHQAGTFKTERVINGKQAASINVAGSERKILNFCANNYLGLSSHPYVIDASKNALDSHGAGLSSVRFICGTTDLHTDLEGKIAKFHGRDDAILFPSCFDANAGFFEVLLNENDAVISDELNHASIIDGIRLCKAKRYRYKNRDMADLEAELQKTQHHRLRLIVTDGVFSMDGSVAKLPEMFKLADQYNALTFLDECHATGLLGANGRGTEEHLGCEGQATFINSTLGKALGGAAGGYTAGPQWMVDLLRQRARPYLFSNSLPPAVVAAGGAALDLICESNHLPALLAQNTARFRQCMADAGFTLSGDSGHPIAPVMLGDARLASVFADKMLEEGVYVIGFSYPVVPKDKARIRVQLSAAHTLQEVDYAVDAFIKVGRQLNVIS